MPLGGIGEPVLLRNNLEKTSSPRGSSPIRTFSIRTYSNSRIIDAIVQSFAPQPNLLARPFSSSDLLARVSTAHLTDLAAVVNEWDFHAGTLDGADLIWSAVLILEHVVNVGGQVLEPFKIPRGAHLVPATVN